MNWWFRFLMSQTGYSLKYVDKLKPMEEDIASPVYSKVAQVGLMRRIWKYHHKCLYRRVLRIFPSQSELKETRYIVVPDICIYYPDTSYNFNKSHNFIVLLVVQCSLFNNSYYQKTYNKSYLVGFFHLDIWLLIVIW